MKHVRPILIMIAFMLFSACGGTAVRKMNGLAIPDGVEFLTSVTDPWNREVTLPMKIHNEPNIEPRANPHILIRSDSPISMQQVRFKGCRLTRTERIIPKQIPFFPSGQTPQHIDESLEFSIDESNSNQIKISFQRPNEFMTPDLRSPIESRGLYNFGKYTFQFTLRLSDNSLGRVTTTFFVYLGYLSSEPHVSSNSDVFINSYNGDIDIFNRYLLGGLDLLLDENIDARRADIDGDGGVRNFDIDPFFTLLLDPVAVPVNLECL